MQYEVKFEQQKEMVDFLSSCRYDDYVTYFDPTKGWILNLNERYRYNERTFESCGIS